MQSIKVNIASIRATLGKQVLVCVSKFHSADAIREAYEAGERDFAESRVQELVTKQASLPKDIRWHFIGHLQTNKVRSILPFIYLIQSVDSLHLLEYINQEAAKINKTIRVLLEVHVAQEQTKSGFSIDELTTLLDQLQHGQIILPHVQIAGIMAMSTNTDNETEQRRCFNAAHSLLEHPYFHMLQPTDQPILSIGMSDDYTIAIECGSTMVRIGTTIFGNRNY